MELPVDNFYVTTEELEILITQYAYKLMSNQGSQKQDEVREQILTRLAEINLELVKRKAR